MGGYRGDNLFVGTVSVVLKVGVLILEIVGNILSPRRLVIRWGVKVLRRGDESPGIIKKKESREVYDVLWVVALNDVYGISYYLIFALDRAWHYGYEC